MKWREYKFSEFAQINPPVKLKSGESYSFVEMKDLSDGQKFCQPSTERLLSGGAKFENGDTLFARITPCLENGKICQVKNLKNGVGFGSTEFYVFRGRENISDSDFIFYLSRWDEVRAFAEMNFDGTSGRQRVPREAFDNLYLTLPGLETQQKISLVLSRLDNKIDLLTRQNKTLEQLAETYFRQWFVEEAETDWKTFKISEVAEVNEKSINKDFYYESIEYLDTGSITEGVIDSFQLYNLVDAPSRAQRIVHENDIIYSLVRPVQRHYGILGNVKPNTIVSTGFAVISCKTISPYFIYMLLTQNDVVEYLDVIAEGSTSAYPSLRPSDIADFEFQMPPEETLKKFHVWAQDTWKKIRSNTIQIEQLKGLRDAMLPKLMSGEIIID